MCKQGPTYPTGSSLNIAGRFDSWGGQRYCNNRSAGQAIGADRAGPVVRGTMLIGNAAVATWIGIDFAKIMRMRYCL